MMAGTQWEPVDGQERLEDRTYPFALRVVRLVQALPEGTAGQRLGDQVLRSGTSIGANVEEAIGASTPRDFTHRMSIAWREARETHFRLRLIADAELVKPERMETLVQEALELRRILGKTVSSAREKLRETGPIYEITPDDDVAGGQNTV